MPGGPLFSSGVEAPDWQRYSAWDGPLLLNFQPGSIAGPVSTAAIPVGSWSGVAGSFTVTVQPMTLSFGWFSDSALTHLLARRFFIMHPLISGGFFPVIHNRGPWLQITVAGIAGNFTPVMLLFGTNRTQQSDAPALQDSLIDRQNIALGAATTDTVYPASYFAGPVGMFGITTAASFTYLLKGLTASNTWDIFAEFSATALVPFNQIVNVPLGAWRLEVTNGGGAGANYYAGITAGFTG